MNIQNTRDYKVVAPSMHIPSDSTITIQESDGKAEVSISTETTVREGSNENLNRKVAVRWKAAKRTLLWDLVAGQLDLVSSPPPPQAEGIPARKKPRIEQPLFATTDEASKTASPDLSVGLLPPAGDDDDVNADPLTDAQPNVVATRATGRWTANEDAQLTSAVANTSKKKWGNEFKTDWDAVAALVPGRTRNQCKSRLKDVLDPIIDRTTRRTGKWVDDEDIKLKDAVERHGAKKWNKIAVLLRGRTKKQCYQRWHHALNPSIALANGRKGIWAEDEDIKLKDAVRTHGGKDWVAISALVPGRTKNQSCQRWHDALYPSIALTAGSTGKWAPNEDDKLKDAVRAYGGKDWDAISALVPGRTRSQCYERWRNVFDPSIDRANGRTGRWVEDEDSKLKDAVQTHGDKDWDAVASLVPGRTKKQCCQRWHHALNPGIDRANGRTGKWAEDEDSKLKDAVRAYGGKDWDAISALVPGRTRSQCSNRWRNILVPSIGRASGSTG